jgi:hypothetical protein
MCDFEILSNASKLLPKNYERIIYFIANHLINCNIWDFDGAEEVTRTPDLLITNQLLYHLSYFGFFILNMEITWCMQAGNSFDKASANKCVDAEMSHGLTFSKLFNDSLN